MWLAVPKGSQGTGQTAGVNFNFAEQNLWNILLVFYNLHVVQFYRQKYGHMGRRVVCCQCFGHAGILFGARNKLRRQRRGEQRMGGTQKSRLAACPRQPWIENRIPSSLSISYLHHWWRVYRKQVLWNCLCPFLPNHLRRFEARRKRRKAKNIGCLVASVAAPELANIEARLTMWTWSGVGDWGRNHDHTYSQVCAHRRVAVYISFPLVASMVVTGLRSNIAFPLSLLFLFPPPPFK